MAAKNFELGDLVWAKMKNCPFWPAQIVNPPVVNEKALNADKGLPKKKTTLKKNHYFVFFYGTRNFSWITHENIVPHSEDIVNKEIKIKSGSYVKAVKEIIRASRGEDSVESDESSGSPEIHKKRGRRSKRKMKHGKTKKSAETLNLHLTTDTQQPFVTDVSNKELSPVQNLSSVSNDHSAPVANISQNIGHDVSVWNRTSEKCQGCVAAGAQQLWTPADVVLNCDIIFCCVSGQEAVGSILWRNDGILHGLERSVPGSKGYIDLTSMNPVTVQKINMLIASKGGKYLEAPISDSMSNIEEGLLLILVTGHRRLFDDCISCFYAIAERICFMNCEVGSASKMNIVLSMLKGSTFAALAESMALLGQGKLLHSNFKNILPLSQMSAPYVIQKCEAMMQNKSTIDTLVKYQQKDLELGIQLSNSYKQPCPMMSAALGIYQTCTQRGYSMFDVSALYLTREETD
ncbi:putative oxidoreductase GLYR1 [Trichonephila clavipes]|nr:putative oxidoreductase GLYR1 [Trichonephila clavipes]